MNGLGVLRLGHERAPFIVAQADRQARRIGGARGGEGRVQAHRLLGDHETQNRLAARVEEPIARVARLKAISAGQRVDGHRDLGQSASVGRHGPRGTGQQELDRLLGQGPPGGGQPRREMRHSKERGARRALVSQLGGQGHRRDDHVGRRDLE